MQKLETEKIYVTKADILPLVAAFTSVQKDACILLNPEDTADQIFNYALFFGEIKRRYFTYHMIIAHFSERISISEATAEAADRVKQWLEQNKANILKAYAALTAAYDPLENYERTEDPRIDKHELVIDSTKGRSTSIKVSNNSDTKTSHNTDLKNTIAAKTTESQDPSNTTTENPTWLSATAQTGKATATYGDKVKEQAAEDNYTTMKGLEAQNYDRQVGLAAQNWSLAEGSAEANYDKEDGKHTTTDTIGLKHIHGTSSTDRQDLLIKELELRRINFKRSLVDRFIDENAFI